MARVAQIWTGTHMLCVRINHSRGSAAGYLGLSGEFWVLAGALHAHMAIKRKSILIVDDLLVSLAFTAYCSWLHWKSVF